MAEEQEIEIEPIAQDRWRIRFRGNLMHVDSQALLDLARWIEVHHTSILLDIDRKENRYTAMTDEQAIEHWTALQQRVSVGAYEERRSEHYEAGTWPEDGVEESLANLESWASKRGLEFCYNHDTQTWSLEPIQPPE
jgi:hypothetical protein